MKKLVLVAGVIAAACLAGACSKAPEDRAAARKPAADQGAASPGSPAPAQTAAKPAVDACALLSAQEATEITGVPVERVEKTADGCAWFANAAAQQQKGAASVSETFQQLNKQEPKSAEEAARSMETMLKGMIGAAGRAGPLFAISVTTENADQGEAILRGTVAAVGGGAPGGKLEPIEGLGDRAFWGPAGSFLLVRKGPALLNLGLANFAGSREQSIALARRMLSRL